jgi:hypothetical protein
VNIAHSTKGGDGPGGKFSDLFVGRREKGLLIEVYRIPGRSDLQRCRARAKVVAAREGFHTEPEVAYFDDRVSGDPDPSDPQGWTFTFDEEVSST